MRIIIFTGKGGSGVSTLAAATTVACARAGRRTLAFGLGPGLGHAFGASLSAKPHELAPNLEAVEGRGRGASDEFRDWLERLVEWRGMDPALADDLSALPGMSHVGRLLDLQAHVASDDHDVIVVDGSPLAQFLELPAALDAASRWLERLFAPRQSNVFEPFLRVFAGDYATAGEDVLEDGRGLLGRLAGLRDEFTDPDVTSVRITLTPDAPSVDAAEQAVAALSLFAYGVDALLVNKIVPDGVTDPFFHPARDEHRETLGSITRAVAPLPVIGVEMRSPAPRGLDALGSLAEDVYTGRDALGIWHRSPEHTVSRAGSQYVMNVSMPFARREEISLEQTDSGVIVHLDGHRCVLPLPREARFYENASWVYGDGVLRVTFER